MSLPPPDISLLQGASLFLDLDGTLVEFADEPQQVVVDEDLRADLHALDDKLDGRLGIISGRCLDDLVGLLGNKTLSMAGSHGLEFRLRSGPAERPSPPGALTEVIERVRAFASARNLIVEVKPAGVALHFRGAPSHMESAIDFMRGLSQASELDLQAGSMVMELRVAGADKGSAVRRFMAEPPFAAGRPVAVGDDLTDENAFQAARDLGGSAILVGDERPTVAQYRLPNVSAVRSWLKQVI